MKVGAVDIDVRVLTHLKEELSWVVDKWLRVISTIMLSTEELIETKEHNIGCVAMWPLVTYYN